MRPLETIEKMRVGYGMVRPDERFSYVNPALADMLGYSRESILGLHPLDLGGPQNVEIVREQLEARRSGIGAPYQMEGFARRGSWLSLLIMPTSMHDSAGSYLGGFSVIEPIGPRKTLHDQELDLARAARGIAAQGETIYSSRRRENLDLSALSAREVEIVSRLLGGNGPSAIAGECSISVHTVRSHLKSIYRKLGVHSQLELAARFRS